MRKPPHKAERYRLREQSTPADGNNGAFRLTHPKTKAELRIIASDGLGWEHVSVSLVHRCPTWEEMCFVKNLFWGPEEAVFQIHPPRSEYVNFHPFCLHLWKPVGRSIPLPKPEMVGPRDL